MAGARLIDIDNQNEPFTYGDSEATVTTIAAIPNQNQGLLIARVVNEQGEYLTFSAVENTDGQEKDARNSGGLRSDSGRTKETLTVINGILPQ
jgi:hypothetical protein